MTSTQTPLCHDLPFLPLLPMPLGTRELLVWVLAAVWTGGQPPGLIRALLHIIALAGTHPSSPTSGQLLSRCHPLTFRVSPWGLYTRPSRIVFTMSDLVTCTPAGMPLIHCWAPSPPLLCCSTGLPLYPERQDALVAWFFPQQYEELAEHRRATVAGGQHFPGHATCWSLTEHGASRQGLREAVGHGGQGMQAVSLGSPPLRPAQPLAGLFHIPNESKMSFEERSLRL